MGSAAINSFSPTLDQVDSWYEIFTLLPILISLELLLSADNAVALASLTKSLESSELRARALNLGITISLLFRIFLILLSNFLLKFIFIRIFAGLYLIYLFFSNVLIKPELVNSESGGPRQILQTEGFIALSPWAPSHPYEFWICPKKHATSFSKISQKEINDLALILRATLGGLSNSLKDVSFNIAFHLSPEKKNSKQIHWHVEVYPQTTPWSGLELGFGIFLNDLTPEKAAEELGSACRKELSALVGIL